MSQLKEQLQRTANKSIKDDKKSIKQLIQIMQPEIEKALPSVITPERFTRIALSAISNNPTLQECDGTSFLGAMMQAAQLGLEPNTPLGQAYLIPYKNNKKGITECQFQIGYKGLIELAHRSGEFKNIAAHVVYDNDVFEYEYGLESKLVHKPALKNRGNAYAYYAVYTLVNGGHGFIVMSKEDVESHQKKYSKAKFSPWNTNFDEMAKKTVLKQLLKYAPIKTEFARNIIQDETVKTKLSNDMSSEQNEMEYIDVESREAEPTPELTSGITFDPETGEELMDGMTSAEIDALEAQK